MFSSKLTRQSVAAASLLALPMLSSVAFSQSNQIRTEWVPGIQTNCKDLVAYNNSNKAVNVYIDHVYEFSDGSSYQGQTYFHWLQPNSKQQMRASAGTGPNSDCKKRYNVRALNTRWEVSR